MKKLIFIFILNLCLFLFYESSNIYAKSYSIGAGSEHCGTLINYERDRVSKDMMYWVYIHWMLGYISGSNYQTQSMKGSNTEGESIYFAAINYCKNHPLKRLNDAIKFIYKNQL